MERTFRAIRELIAEQKFEELRNLQIIKPEFFNWATDIFEGIHVKETPDANALLWTDGNTVHNFTFLQISRQTNQLLNFLRNKGVQQNSVILTQMSLQPLNWFSLLATIKGGFRMIPAANILGVPDMVYRFKKLMPEVVIADADNAFKIEEAERLCGKNIAVKIIAEGKREGWYTPEDIKKEDDRAAGAVTRADDSLFLFFTSGTTGLPKIAVHTHLSYPFGHLTTSSWIGLRQEDIHYNISQPGWAKFAWSSFFAPWNVGASIFAFHQTGRFNAKETLILIEKHKISTFCAPPTVLRMLIQEDLKSYQFNLRECVAAGEPLNPEVIETWKKGTGILIRDGFGQTESTCLVANLAGDEVKLGSMGKPTFLYDVIIADQNGIEQPIAEEGNICVRMDTGKPNGIFRDYFEDPEKKKEVFKHGLYYTGDKAYQDEDGYIWFVGRDDDVIKSSDYRIGPFEVESVLLEHGAVLESAVIGSPHLLKGLEVKAFVVLNVAYHPDEVLADQLFCYCRDKLSPYKMPRIIEFVTELPKTISGKIRRVELRGLEADRKAKGMLMEHEHFYSRKF
ncbi:acetyl-CoA synthetase [Pedobacter cryoconitis]|uniref:Acetyl-CoA synthetase n=1 Tax=Pedobacter cryoconitis TaxID=188932 RepID=A0A7W8ZRZ3_9SPHI|nr:AMP-binding protein [Pedobacter cryoconitis]MBB5638777.1 acetyl-CoA synthetase [Pedobacter cryoconitis]